ncbi:MAG: dethiobiotin synthase, partial [Lachnospiraceae bacterium]|nr:dethiobiotin synthase [Lachnospiraceae bacterium]
IRGIILNHYSGGVMQEDNIRMIEELTGIPVVAVVRDGDDEIEISPENLCDMYGEISVSR